jgi:hypothetical protein
MTTTATDSYLDIAPPPPGAGADIWGRGRPRPQNPSERRARTGGCGLRCNRITGDGRECGHPSHKG